MKSKIAESYIDSKVEEVDDVIKFGAPKLVVRLHNAIRAVELAEQETEERMRAKAHKIVKEMMEGVFQGNMPQNIADEFSQKLNEE